MSRIVRLNLLVFIAAAALVAGSVAFAGTHVTTGHFLVEIAKAQSLDASDPASAASSLRSIGFRLPDVELDRPLTEGTVSSIATAMGIRVSTKNPDALFSSEQMNLFLRSFSRELGTRTSEPLVTGTDPLTKGKGKKKGLTKSRSEPF